MTRASRSVPLSPLMLKPGNFTTCPIGSCPGQYFCAIALLTITTGGPFVSSAALKPRPRIIGVPTTGMKSGLTALNLISMGFCNSGWLGSVTLACMPPSEGINGERMPYATLSTPGNARNLAMTASRIGASGSCVNAASTWLRVMPMLCVRVLIKLRTSAPIDTSSANEIPICSQTAARRRNGALPAVRVPTFACIAGSSSLRATWLIGTRARNSMVISANNAANANTRPSTWKRNPEPNDCSITGSSIKRRGNAATRAAARARPAARLKMPSSRFSTSNCRATAHRRAPSESRRATSGARVRARASSRCATFTIANSTTPPTMAKSSIPLVPAWLMR